VGSIARRLLVGNAVVLAVFVVLTGLAVSWSVHRQAETARFERLQGLVYGLLGATEITPDARLVVDESALPERRLARPVAGLYAELVGNDGERLWQSRSSIGRTPAVRVTPVGEWTFDRLPRDGAMPAVDHLQLQSVWVLESGEELPFIAHVADETGSLGAELSRFERTLWATLLGVALLLLAVQALVLRRGLAPLERLGADVRAIERGERDALDPDVPRELVPLAGGLNALLASERGRRARYRHLLDDLAHTLKTPLTILGNLKAPDGACGRQPSRAPDQASGASRSAERSGSADEMVETVHDQAARMRASIERSLERATRHSASVLAPPLPLRPVLERLARSLGKVEPFAGVRFDVAVDPSVTVRVADVDLHEILGNVLENACKYGAARVRVWTDGDDGSVLVDDDGPGFPADRERLLERGERADTRVAGQGLGLAASRELMRAHGGELALAASPRGGARVVLRFPRASAVSAPR